MPYQVPPETPGAYYSPGQWDMESGTMVGAGFYIPDEMAAPYLTGGGEHSFDTGQTSAPTLDTLSLLQAQAAAATPEGAIMANIRPLTAWDMESGHERPSGFSAPSYLTQEQFTSWDPFMYLGLAPEQTAALWEYARANPGDPLIQDLAGGKYSTFGGSYLDQQFYPGDPAAYLAQHATDTGRLLSDAINAGYDVGLTPGQAGALQSYVTQGGHFWREQQEEDTLSSILQTITPIIIALGGAAVGGEAIAGTAGATAGAPTAAQVGGAGFESMLGSGMVGAPGTTAGTVGAGAGLGGSLAELGAALGSSQGMVEAGLGGFAGLGGGAGEFGNLYQPSLNAADYGVQEANWLDRMRMAFESNPLGTLSNALKGVGAVGSLVQTLGGGSGGSGGGAGGAGGALAAGTAPNLPTYPAFNRQAMPYAGDWLKYAQALPTQTGAEHQFFQPQMASGGALAHYQGGGFIPWENIDWGKVNVELADEQNLGPRFFQMRYGMTPEQLRRIVINKAGLEKRARGGALALIAGPGGGQDDLVDAKVSPGEYVMDADVVSALGDGSNEEGARKLDQMRERIRVHKRRAPKSKIPAKAKKPEAYLRG